MDGVNNTERSHIIRPACESPLSQAYVVTQNGSHRTAEHDSDNDTGSARLVFRMPGQIVLVQTIGYARESHLLPFSLADVVVVAISCYSIMIWTSAPVYDVYVLRVRRQTSLNECWCCAAPTICIATKSYWMLLLYNINKYGEKKSSAAASSPAHRQCVWLRQQQHRVQESGSEMKPRRKSEKRTKIKSCSH